MKVNLNIKESEVIKILKEINPNVTKETIHVVLTNIENGNLEIDKIVSTFYYKWIRQQAQVLKEPVEPKKAKYSFLS